MPYTPEYGRKYRENNKDKHNAYMRSWHAANKDKVRFYNRRNKLARYGITHADYDALVEKYNNKCAICGKGPENERYKKLNVDHCHQTGRVRGLLCTPCNHALGRLGDTTESIERVLAYLTADPS